MAQPVNLNRFRKQKARAAKKARADENAVKFGRTQAAKSVDDAENESIVKKLDQHRMSRTPRDQDDPA